MLRILKRFVLHGSLLAVVVCLSGACPVCGFAQGLSFADVDKRIAYCTRVLKQVIPSSNGVIPLSILQRCRGIAVFPGVVKAGAVLGISYGSGVVVRRDEATAKWSKPAFFNIRGGSIGLQLGAESVDLVLLIMSERGVQALLEGKFTLGADVGVTAGPVGREVSAQTNTGFEAGILSYSRAKGLFAGVSLKGAALEPDTQANEAYHGKGTSVQDVFYEGLGALSDNAQELIKILDNATEPEPSR